MKKPHKSRNKVVNVAQNTNTEGKTAPDLIRTVWRWIKVPLKKFGKALATGIIILVVFRNLDRIQNGTKEAVTSFFRSSERVTQSAIDLLVDVARAHHGEVQLTPPTVGPKVSPTPQLNTEPVSSEVSAVAQTK